MDKLGADRANRRTSRPRLRLLQPWFLR